MRYEGTLYRPPSEADAYIVQATIGCSWNHCTYCDMYRDKTFRVRELRESLEDLELGARALGPSVQKLFVADGDALVMPMDHWRPILARARALFPNLRRVSAYAMARNVHDKTDAELRELRDAGLSTLYIGPESGDDATLKRIAKGDDAAAHVEAARRVARRRHVAQRDRAPRHRPRSKRRARAGHGRPRDRDGPRILRGAHGHGRPGNAAARSSSEGALRGARSPSSFASSGRWSTRRGRPTRCSARTTPRTIFPSAAVCRGIARASWRSSTRPGGADPAAWRTIAGALSRESGAGAGPLGPGPLRDGRSDLPPGVRFCHARVLSRGPLDAAAKSRAAFPREISTKLLKALWLLAAARSLSLCLVVYADERSRPPRPAPPPFGRPSGSAPHGPIVRPHPSRVGPQAVVTDAVDGHLGPDRFARRTTNGTGGTFSQREPDRRGLVRDQYRSAAAEPGFCLTKIPTSRTTRSPPPLRVRPGNDLLSRDLHAHLGGPVIRVARHDLEDFRMSDRRLALPRMYRAVRRDVLSLPARSPPAPSRRPSVNQTATSAASTPHETGCRTHDGRTVHLISTRQVLRAPSRAGVARRCPGASGARPPTVRADEACWCPARR